MHEEQGRAQLGHRRDRSGARREVAALDPEDALLALDEEKRERAGEGLGGYRRQGRARDAPFEGEDEERREHRR